MTGVKKQGVTVKWGGNWNSQAKELISDILQSKSAVPQAIMGLNTLLSVTRTTSASTG